MSGVGEKIVAVIVSYCPDMNVLGELIQSLAEQVDNIVVVDNSAAEDKRTEALLACPGLSLIRFGENRGVAEALNKGIEKAFDMRADYVLLSDQDSLPAPDMVIRLKEAYRQLSAQGVRVGALGPTFSDVYSGRVFPFKVQREGKLFWVNVVPSDYDSCVDALSVITSGCLIPVPVLHRVGFMMEPFFIDNVDLEWCLRARALGFKIFGVANAKMKQRMGMAVLRVWFFGWKEGSSYQPVRLYYQVRNLVAMWSLPYVGLSWLLPKTVLTVELWLCHVLFSSFRGKCFKFGLLGLFHGLQGRMGRVD